MKNSDQGFKDWLMAYRPTLRHGCQQEVVDRAITAMESPNPFIWWAEGEYLRLKHELVAGFPFTDHSLQISLSRQGTVMMVIKSRWEATVKSRIVEMNPPQGAGKANP